MFNGGRHILVIGRILVGLFILANSGFTLTVRECMMQQSSCCSTPKALSTHRADNPMAVTSPIPFCCQTQVAGGLNDHLISTLQSGSIDSYKVPLAALIPIASDAHGFDPVSFSSLHTYLVQNPAPPRVEKYVLNVSLLI